MGDLKFIVIVFACFAATGGLLVLCQRLMPRETNKPQGTKP